MVIYTFEQKIVPGLGSREWTHFYPSGFIPFTVVDMQSAPSLRSSKARPEVREKVLTEVPPGFRKNFLELASATRANRGDLAAALDELILEGLLVKTSDGFVTLYARRS